MIITKFNLKNLFYLACHLMLLVNKNLKNIDSKWMNSKVN